MAPKQRGKREKRKPDAATRAAQHAQTARGMLGAPTRFFSSLHQQYTPHSDERWLPPTSAVELLSRGLKAFSKELCTDELANIDPESTMGAMQEALGSLMDMFETLPHVQGMDPLECEDALRDATQRLVMGQESLLIDHNLSESPDSNPPDFLPSIPSSEMQECLDFFPATEYVAWAWVMALDGNISAVHTVILCICATLNHFVHTPYSTYPIMSGLTAPILGCKLAEHLPTLLNKLFDIGMRDPTKLGLPSMQGKFGNKLEPYIGCLRYLMVRLALSIVPAGHRSFEGVRSLIAVILDALIPYCALDAFESETVVIIDRLMMLGETEELKEWASALLSRLLQQPKLPITFHYHSFHHAFSKDTLFSIFEASPQDAVTAYLSMRADHAINNASLFELMPVVSIASQLGIGDVIYGALRFCEVVGLQSDLSLSDLINIVQILDVATDLSEDTLRNSPIPPILLALTAQLHDAAPESPILYKGVDILITVTQKYTQAVGPNGALFAHQLLPEIIRLGAVHDISSVFKPVRKSLGSLLSMTQG